MFSMFKKVNAKEVVVGWYSTGPRIRAADLAINKLIARFVENPVYVIIDVAPAGNGGLPTSAYVVQDEIKEDGTAFSHNFQHITSEIGAVEAEEIGVEHLLRDVKDTTVSSISQDVAEKIAALKTLESKIGDMANYLASVESGKLPINHDISYAIQDIFNLLPNLDSANLQRAFAEKSNDLYMGMFLASVIRSVVAVHSLIDNKIDLQEAENAPKDQSEKEEKQKQKQKGKEEKSESKNAEKKK